MRTLAFCVALLLASAAVAVGTPAPVTPPPSDIGVESSSAHPMGSPPPTGTQSACDIMIESVKNDCESWVMSMNMQNWTTFCGDDCYNRVVEARECLLQSEQDSRFATETLPYIQLSCQQQGNQYCGEVFDDVHNRTMCESWGEAGCYLHNSSCEFTEGRCRPILTSAVLDEACGTCLQRLNGLSDVLGSAQCYSKLLEAARDLNTSLCVRVGGVRCGDIVEPLKNDCSTWGDSMFEAPWSEFCADSCLTRAVAAKSCFLLSERDYEFAYSGLPFIQAACSAQGDHRCGDEYSGIKHRMDCEDYSDESTCTNHSTYCQWEDHRCHPIVGTEFLDTVCAGTCLDLLINRSDVLADSRDLGKFVEVAQMLKTQECAVDGNNTRCGARVEEVKAQCESWAMGFDNTTSFSDFCSHECFALVKSIKNCLLRSERDSDFATNVLPFIELSCQRNGEGYCGSVYKKLGAQSKCNQYPNEASCNAHSDVCSFVDGSCKERADATYLDTVCNSCLRKLTNQVSLQHSEDFGNLYALAYSLNLAQCVQFNGEYCSLLADSYNSSDSTSAGSFCLDATKAGCLRKYLPASAELLKIGALLSIQFCAYGFYSSYMNNYTQYLETNCLPCYKSAVVEVRRTFFMLENICVRNSRDELCITKFDQHPPEEVDNCYRTLQTNNTCSATCDTHLSDFRETYGCCFGLLIAASNMTVTAEDIALFWAAVPTLDEGPGSSGSGSWSSGEGSWPASWSGSNGNSWSSWGSASWGSSHHDDGGFCPWQNGGHDDHGSGSWGSGSWGSGSWGSWGSTSWGSWGSGSWGSWGSGSGRRDAIDNSSTDGNSSSVGSWGEGNSSSWGSGSWGSWGSWGSGSWGSWGSTSWGSWGSTSWGSWGSGSWGSWGSGSWGSWGSGSWGSWGSGSWSSPSHGSHNGNNNGCHYREGGDGPDLALLAICPSLSNIQEEAKDVCVVQKAEKKIRRALALQLNCTAVNADAAIKAALIAALIRDIAAAVGLDPSFIVDALLDCAISARRAGSATFNFAIQTDSSSGTDAAAAALTTALSTGTMSFPAVTNTVNTMCTTCASAEDLANFAAATEPTDDGATSSASALQLVAAFAAVVVAVLCF